MRITYIKMFFDSFDKASLGYLNYKQARDFFQQVLNLNFRKRNHRKTIVRIIKIVDPEYNKFVVKERIIDFFLISGFKIIDQLNNEQKRLFRAILKTKEEDKDAETSFLLITKENAEDSSTSSSDSESDS